MKITDDTLATLSDGSVLAATAVLRALAETYESPDHSEAIIFTAAANLAERRGIEVFERVLAQ